MSRNYPRGSRPCLFERSASSDLRQRRGLEGVTPDCAPSCCVPSGTPHWVSRSLGMPCTRPHGTTRPDGRFGEQEPTAFGGTLLSALSYAAPFFLPLDSPAACATPHRAATARRAARPTLRRRACSATSTSRTPLRAPSTTPRVSGDVRVRSAWTCRRRPSTQSSTRRRATRWAPTSRGSSGGTGRRGATASWPGLRSATCCLPSTRRTRRTAGWRRTSTCPSAGCWWRTRGRRRCTPRSRSAGRGARRVQDVRRRQPRQLRRQLAAPLVPGLLPLRPDRREPARLPLRCTNVRGGTFHGGNGNRYINDLPDGRIVPLWHNDPLLRGDVEMRRSATTSWRTASTTASSSATTARSPSSRVQHRRQRRRRGPQRL